ncbi:hypothetical protein FACS189479_04960 [Spirochaetia bacterium]|nr:hypothetical protein FACS189479_04960 [Spirochaetia bacterium]
MNRDIEGADPHTGNEKLNPNELHHKPENNQLRERFMLALAAGICGQEDGIPYGIGAKWAAWRVYSLAGELADCLDDPAAFFDKLQAAEKAHVDKMMKQAGKGNP